MPITRRSDFPHPPRLPTHILQEWWSGDIADLELERRSEQPPPRYRRLVRSRRPPRLQQLRNERWEMTEAEKTELEEIRQANAEMIGQVRLQDGRTGWTEHVEQYSTSQPTSANRSTERTPEERSPSEWDLRTQLERIHRSLEHERLVERGYRTDSDDSTDLSLRVAIREHEVL